MTDGDRRFISPEGYSVDCTMVRAGTGKAIWNLVVQMDEAREEKRSQIFYTPSFSDAEPTIQFDSHSWIGGFWVSPSGTLYCCDGRFAYVGAPGSLQQLRLSDRQILRVWGLDEKTVFFFGNNGLVLRRDGSDWRDISLADGRRILDIHGASANLIYGVGQNGAFCRLVNDGWELIDLGTDADLRALHVLPDGTVYIGGENALAIRYRDGEASFLTTEADRYFSGVAAFRGKMYFGATGRGVDVLEGGAVLPFKPNIFGQHLSANQDYLWSCGGNSIFRFDGEGWFRKDFQ